MKQNEAYEFIEKHYRENYDLTVKRVNRFLKDQERSKDVTQEAYLRALMYYTTLDSLDQFEPWFATLLGNCIKDNQKSESLRGMADDIDNIEIPIKARAIPKIIYDQVQQRIFAKPKEQAVILDLFLNKQYRPKEIAQIVPDTANSIRQIVHRFRQELRTEFNWNM